MPEQSPPKCALPEDIDTGVELAFKRHHASADVELDMPDITSLSFNGAESLSSSMGPVRGDNYSGGISGGIVGGRDNRNLMIQINPPHTSAGLKKRRNVPKGLVLATATNAIHNSADRHDPPRCHKMTRLAILQGIMDWIEGQDQATRDCSVMWLYGPAGSGKSAIAQTVAETLYEKGMFLASYFFRRLDLSRNHSRSLIPTIAYQMACHLPAEFREGVSHSIDQDQLIFTKDLETQIKSLIVLPVQPLIKKGYFVKNNAARVMIIDGLDECIDRKEQEDILHSLSAALQRYQLPFRLFIASRKELEIEDAFNSDTLECISTRLTLEDDCEADSDIEHFLWDEFENIKQTHMLADKLPTAWPSYETIKTLVRKSSGQFIYASTVIKFLKERRGRPDERLDIILGIQPPDSEDRPFSELDTLYYHILSNVEETRKWEKVSLILSFYILRNDSSDFSTEVIEALLGLKPGDICLLLSDLGSIVRLEVYGQTCLEFYHASFQDFLLDESRSKKFHINPATGHTRLMHQILIFFQDSSPRRWTAGSSNYLDLTILKPHIELAHSSQELEAQILDFKILRFFDHQFPSYVAYSIPHYLSVIKESRVKNAEMAHRIQEDALLDHVKKELARYSEGPCLDFFLLCLSGDIEVRPGDRLQFSDIFPFVKRDSLWLAQRWRNIGVKDVGDLYIGALKTAARDMISQQTVTSAALYTLKEVSGLLARECLDSTARFLLDTCKHLLTKAARSDDLITCIQNLALPFILDKNPGVVEEIDAITYNYLTRMSVASAKDYVSFSHQALTKLLQWAAFDEMEFYESHEYLSAFIESFVHLLKKAGWSEDYIDVLTELSKWEAPDESKCHKSHEYLRNFIQSFGYFLEISGRSEDLIDDVQKSAAPFKDHTRSAVKRIENLLKEYLRRTGIASKRDFASFFRRAVVKISAVTVKREEGRYNIDFKAELDILIEVCGYLLENASQSEEFLDFVQQFRQSLLDMSLEGSEFECLDIAILGYLSKLGGAPNLDYVSMALHALRRSDELMAQADDPEKPFSRFQSVCSDEISLYLLGKAGWSIELYTYRKPPSLRFIPWYVDDALERYRERMRANNSQLSLPSPSAEIWDSD